MAIFRGSGSASSTSDQATIDEVTQQATNAANSATSAASSASSAASSASSASSSASTATTKASEASTSATNAAISEFNASAFAASASTSNANAGASATTALSAETAATTAKTAAEAAQVAAESAQTAAETAETGAASSASTASTAATTATTKASEASASATTASSAATAAESARDSTLAAFDSFDDRYLGSKTADPTLDNDGNALVGGALYFNSVDEVMKVYTGSQWVAAYADVSGALLAVNNLSDLNNTTSARTNLGLGTAATTASTDYATAAQGTLAASATQPGDNISTLTNDSGYITGYTVTQGDVTAHQAALSITESQISDLSHTTSLPFASITSTPTTLVGYGITDAASDTELSTAVANSANWDTAYGWGDHSTQNYATTTGDTMTGDLNFGDNVSAVFGAGSDFKIFHNGDNTYMNDLGTGNLYISTDGAEVSLRKVSGNEAMLIAKPDAEVELYYDDSLKLETTSTGVSVTGKATGTLTTDDDLSFDMNASNYFKCTPTGNGTLTFTNITAGQSGNIWLDNSGGHTISAAASTYIASADLTTISTAGVYFLSYYSDGTNVMVSATPAVTSAGA